MRDQSTSENREVGDAVFTRFRWVVRVGRSSAEDLDGCAFKRENFGVIIQELAAIR